MSIDRILAAAAAQPWALMPEKLAEIRAFLELRSEGVRFTAAEIEARVGPGRTGESGVTGPGAVAVIPIIGIMTQRGNMLDAISGPGGTSTEMVGARLRQAIANPDVKSILLEIDSPGGSTYGVQELADEVLRARGRKTVVAQVNSLAASAAYWVASAASEVVMTPGGDVGSIGVYGTHSDMSGAMEKAGIRKTFISAGKYKTEGHPFEPLTDEARDYAQRRVNEAYETFVGSVARGRGRTSAQVKAEFGQGRTVGAREAVRLGMVDRIGTMQDTYRRLSTAAPIGVPSRALAPAGMLASGAVTANDLRIRRHLHRLRTL